MEEIPLENTELKLEEAKEGKEMDTSEVVKNANTIEPDSANTSTTNNDIILPLTKRLSDISGHEAPIPTTTPMDGDEELLISENENKVLLTIVSQNLTPSTSSNDDTNLPVKIQNGTDSDVTIAFNQLQHISDTKKTKPDSNLNQVSFIKSNREASSGIKVLSSHVISHGFQDVKVQSPNKPETSSLLKSMQSRLAKKVEQKSNSTGIEIPHELISNDMASPPIILNTHVNKSSLQNQDLIAILEGDDTNQLDDIKIESHERHDEDGDEMLEQIQISIIGEDGQIEDLDLLVDTAPEPPNVQEIALRQIMSLPKKNKRKTKIEKRDCDGVEEEPEFFNNAGGGELSGNDLVSSLVSDWSDNESKVDDPPKSPLKKKTPSKVALALAKTIPISPKKSIFTTSVDIKPLPAVEKVLKVTKAKRPASKYVASPMVINSPIKIINKDAIQSPDPIPPFKRSRVIKKKIIWDPDAPETQISYASLIGSTTVKKIQPSVKTPVSKVEMVKISAVLPTSVRTIPSTVPKTSTPKTTVAATLAKIPATTTIIKSPMSGEKAKQTEVIEQKPFIVSVKSKKKASLLKRPRAKKDPIEKKENPTPMSRKRALPETVVGASCIPTAVKKKKLSEVDKLLGDEGAINMMYSLEKDNQNAEIIENIEADDDNFGAKARVIRNVVINKSISPNTSGRSRPKRDVTPVKHLLQEQQQEILHPAATAVIGKKHAPTRKKPSAKKNDSWDFVYAQQTDDSMIIRRRSNSSYSSTSPRRLSLDLSNQQSDQSAIISLDVSLEKPVASKFVFVKPVNKKMPLKLEDVKVGTAIVSEMKRKMTKVMKKGGKAAAVNPQQPLSDNTLTSLALPEPTGRKSRAQSNAAKVSSPTTVLPIQKPITATSLKEISIHHHENVVEISIKTDVKAKNSLSIPMMQEITTILNTLKTSNRCNVVLLIAKSDIFAGGIDYSTLIQPSVEKRKVAAQEMCSNMSEFLKALANFPKQIVYGCDGKSNGISVSFLPLFDVVFATERSSFEILATSTLLPEFSYILSLFGNIKKAIINEMLILGKIMDATSAYENGLITKILMHEKFHEQLLAEAHKISLSVQTLRPLKYQQNKDLLPQLEKLLNAEQKTLIQHWISHECQEKFKQLS